MSHEIRTPLNGIVSAAYLLKNTELSPTQKEYVESIEMSSQLLLSLINDFLDLSKIDAGKVELENIPFDLEQVIHNSKRLMSLQAHNKQIPINVFCEPDFDDNNRSYLGDPNRISQVLLNFLSNALKFTEKGKVDVLINLTPVENSLKSCIRITVKDTGIGIKDTSKLFTPFVQGDVTVQRKYGGSGLGLHISQGLVKLMGGELGISSIPELGTSIWFEITLVKCKIEQNSQLVENIDDILVNQKIPCKILIAEDNVVNQKVLRQMLSRLRYDDSFVTIVKDGKDAIAAISESHTRNEPFQLW